ncbi:hypothetical protein ACEN9X_10870 [Mucilaginibacter sp. Mucisp86]|uniref:hypothetical protein n=1 Tax=Mucilaginibacter sp. Mucisp86 TaxID=3243060 RepID=UPI0039B612FE
MTFLFKIYGYTGSADERKFSNSGRSTPEFAKAGSIALDLEAYRAFWLKSDSLRIHETKRA